jgi:hypothetical protein
MTKLRAFRCAAVALAGLGLITPRCVLRAGETPASKAAVVDIALDESGDLAGAVVATDGKPVDGAVVTLSKQGKAVARTTTNEAGAFALASVKGGTYEIQAGDSARLVRVWHSEAAPPAAAESATLVVGQTVRGQDGGYYEAGGFDFLTLATLATSAGALAIGIVNQADLNDLKDDVDDLASP